MENRHLSILGVGLLGGSIGLALKSVSNDYYITGYGHRSASLDRACEFGAIDAGTTDVAKAVSRADLVVLCTPVGLFRPILKQVAENARPGAIITDVGSTKRSVVKDAEELLPKGVQFVGSHPMAGSEKRGVEYARTDLFQNALCLTTPTARTDPTAVEVVEQFWRLLGMRTMRLSPEDHDRLLAEVSHLPHVVAAALVAMQSDAGLPLAGKGFLDATRIAGGDGALWRDILLDNRDNVRSSLKRLQGQLKALLRRLDENDGKGLADWLDSAAARRQALLQQKLREVTPD